MFHVAFDGFNQVRNQVVAARQLHINLCKRIADTIALIDKAVVYADRPKYDGSNNAEEDKE